jgi:2-keto-myo-inositol isomerase
VHDTFHHTLAHGGPLFPDHTGIVHVSGVVDQAVSLSEMRDGHRVLVTPGDRLGNVDQITALHAAGWTGPVSFEAFSPEVHALTHPEAALRASMDHVQRAVS